MVYRGCKAPHLAFGSKASYSVFLSDQKTKALEQQLQAKDTEMKQQDAKYKSYLEKAKTVIVAFEQPVGGSNVGSGYSRAEFDALRRQLQEKEKLIQRMQVRWGGGR